MVDFECTVLRTPDDRATSRVSFETDDSAVRQSEVELPNGAASLNRRQEQNRIEHIFE